MKEVVGREAERRILQNILQSDEAELVAMYGRRRVGKTYLIRKTFAENMIFEFSGVHNALLKEQLLNFSNTLASYTTARHNAPPVPSSWTQAFIQLRAYAEPLLKKRKAKCVIFFDEFPWLNSPRSGFLSAFEYFWNTWGSKQNRLVVVICGSAASWMIQNVVNAKGGLHNRITCKIRLLPFTLAETAAFLKSRQVNLDLYQIALVYMAIGGIPQYLKDIKPGQSAAQNIDRLCFTKEGALQNEFSILYQSLFAQASRHIEIVKALAASPQGLTRKEIISKCGFTSGGSITGLIEELLESGFITSYLPYKRNARDSILKLSDEYSRFYLKFIDNSRATGPGTWIKRSTSPTWKSWSGLAFESICLKHTQQIKAALGISGVITEESAWRSTSPGVQIDLLLDRGDSSISICEMKFYSSEFTIDKNNAAELEKKRNMFKEKTKTSKALFLVMVTTHGTANNSYKLGLIQNDVVLEDLFK